ncbi:MAG TPA: serine/threonine-protein kinase, partial [Gemmatimonadales bacterium]|nr:serine/threonine-protein kinase [Gemmatimonadales bacterium]
MNGSRFERLEALFHEALPRSPAERAILLERVCRDDPALGVEVERLLEAHDRAGAFIQVPAATIPGLGNEPIAGRRIGPYRVVRELGRGGMGAVYLAERADGAFAQRVAIKLIKRGMDTDHVLARFRAERQILASLDHPNIARLLDGGSTEQGVPFFAMEFIEGEPIDAYADRLSLSVEDRLRLFLQVCGAVTYAHQHLVIHRDIKPLNILVTSDGTPKLLDFGIAKVLHAEGEDATSTVTGLRLLTPEYASPEQVDGRHATTVSDVYSLGVVLYELLTGRSPYRPRSRTPLDVVEAVRTTDPDRPSAAGGTEKLRKRLRGDLDTILLTALRKEAARRYQSVEQLAADLRRHLDGLPVRARPDTFRYRAGKFVRRNRVAVAAGALVVLAMVGGTVATAYQARQARAAQARAERRFADVRKLANALLFDYHDAIRDLKGARPVRERLVRDALGYFDGLASEAHDDPSLQRELAAAYIRVGDLQQSDPSGGDLAGAARSYDRSLSMLEALLRADSADARVRRDAAGVALSLGRLVWERGDQEAGLAHVRRARALLAPLVRADTMDMSLRLKLASAIDLEGQIALEAGDIEGSARHHREGLGLLETAPEAQRRHELVRHAVSVAYGYLADAQNELGVLPGALESRRRSFAIRSELAADYPNNEVYATNRGTARYYFATVLASMGRWEEALGLFRQNLAEDPAGGFANCRVGDALAELGRYDEALPYLRRALLAHEKELRADTVNLARKLSVLEDQARVCKTLSKLGRADAPGACSQTARFAGAIRVEPEHAFPRAFIAIASTQVGEGYEAIGARATTTPEDRRRYRAAALEMHRRSRDIWSDLKARGLVSPVDTYRVSAA